MKLEITDFLGKKVSLTPRVELYNVQNLLLGKEMPGLAVVLDKADDEFNDQYAVLTVSLGEFISIKNSAYIDTNNCPFAEQLLTQGIAESTGLTKTSGFCTYPLWIFKEDFLKEIGGENYQKYSDTFDEYSKIFAPSENEGECEDMDEDDSLTMHGM